MGRIYLFWAHLFMFILSAYVCSDKHSLTFRHYSGMSAPYPKPHPSSLPLESEPACLCLIAKVHFSWAEMAWVMCTRACHCHLLLHQLQCYCDDARQCHSAELNRRVSGSTLLQQHHPNLTCPKNNLVVLTSGPPPRAIFLQGLPSALATIHVINDLGVIPHLKASWAWSLSSMWMRKTANSDT